MIYYIYVFHAKLDMMLHLEDTTFGSYVTLI